MTDLFRKYVSFVALILMGLFLLDLTNTDKEDFYIVEQTEIQSNISFDCDEFDEDEDSDFELMNTSDSFQSIGGLCTFTTIGEEQAENMCSAALRLGQVRRHAPRKSLADSHNHIITKNMEDGADFGSGHLFLSYNSIIYQLKSN